MHFLIAELPLGVHICINMATWDYELISRQLITSLRGKRNRTSLSRRLGYKTNVLYAWETGRRYPTGAELMRLADAVGVSPADAVDQFIGGPQSRVLNVDLCTKQGFAALLNCLRATAPFVNLANRSGLSRYALARWFHGETEPRVPEVLQLIELTTGHLLDFVDVLANAYTIPCVCDAWSSLERVRQNMAERPWLHLIKSALELDAYCELPAHNDDWIAEHCGLTPEQVSSGLHMLRETGEITWKRNRWHLAQSRTLNERRNADGGRSLLKDATIRALDRMERGLPGGFGYLTFVVSNEDMKLIHKLGIEYYRRVRSIVARSRPKERVATLNFQIFAHDAESAPWQTAAAVRPMPKKKTSRKTLHPESSANP